MSAELMVEPKQPAPGDVPRRYTYAQVCAEFAESSQPSELWDGALVMSPSPSFSHQEILLRFYRQLHDWCENRGLGKVITAPIDMVLSDHSAGYHGPRRPDLRGSLPG